MDVEIRGQPAFAHLAVTLAPGERIVAVGGSMASMSADIGMQTRLNGGFWRGLLRRIFGGTSLFINEFTAASAGHVILTQPVPGDIACIELNGTSLFMQPGSFLACEPGVRLGVGWAGIRSLFGGEGLFRLRVSGRGRVWFGAYGAVFARELEGEYVVDSGHLVAYEPTIAIRIGLAGGLFSSVFSGEGLVMRLRGPGKVYLQSRSFGGLAAWTNAHLV